MRRNKMIEYLKNFFKIKNNGALLSEDEFERTLNLHGFKLDKLGLAHVGKRKTTNYAKEELEIMFEKPRIIENRVTGYAIYRNKKVIDAKSIRIPFDYSKPQEDYSNAELAE